MRSTCLDNHATGVRAAPRAPARVDRVAVTVIVAFMLLTVVRVLAPALRAGASVAAALVTLVFLVVALGLATLPAWRRRGPWAVVIRARAGRRPLP